MGYTVMDMSGIYCGFPYKGEFEEIQILSFQQLTGTNCYCSPEAEEEIGRKINKSQVENLHFLDSGNYHYLSKIWMEKIQEPFSLFVMDHHTDMQPSMFSQLLSCGDWIQKAADTNKNLQHIYLVGPPGEDIEQIHPSYASLLTVCSQEDIRQGKIMDMLTEMKENQKVYVSIDKDILGNQDARTQWTQGEMTLTEMCHILDKLKSSQEILGVDICGEGDLNASDEDKLINYKTNMRLLDFMLPWFDSEAE